MCSVVHTLTASSKSFFMVLRLISINYGYDCTCSQSESQIFGHTCTAKSSYLYGVQWMPLKIDICMGW